MVIYTSIVFVVAILVVMVLPISKPANKGRPFCPKANNTDRDFSNILKYVDEVPYSKIK